MPAADIYDFCLLIPCYNNLPGLIQSLQSVYYNKPYLILIIDDGSENPVTKKELEGFYEKNEIVILRLEKNQGITHALNRGLQWITDNIVTEYIARLDCGDICVEDRFIKQVNYLKTHPDVGLLGSWCIFENKNSGLKYKYITPVTHKKIMREMHFRSVFIHPTVMFRKQLLQTVGCYPYNYPFAEDYAFFWKILKTSRGAVIPEFLVIYEINPKGISLKNRQKQLTSRQNIISTFAGNAILKWAGLIKLTLTKLLPVGLILKLKKIFFGFKATFKSLALSNW